MQNKILPDEEVVKKKLTPNEKIEALTAELAEAQDDLLRLKADFQNRIYST